MILSVSLAGCNENTVEKLAEAVICTARYVVFNTIVYDDVLMTQ